ncbi:hypothetical protein [Herbidospora mongoliensis]|uniref:hypothetical protein n=1 Tax=Herbidospora mongoliensis TaxID=688067 RepID=UPI00082DCC0B|nr:hypothetical protein [Herbidospora mongoliensis]
MTEMADRIQAELDKPICGAHPREGLALLVDMGLADAVLPELEPEILAAVPSMPGWSACGFQSTFHAIEGCRRRRRALKPIVVRGMPLSGRFTSRRMAACVVATDVERRRR